MPRRERSGVSQVLTTLALVAVGLAIVGVASGALGRLYSSLVPQGVDVSVVEDARLYSAQDPLLEGLLVVTLTVTCQGDCEGASAAVTRLLLSDRDTGATVEARLPPGGPWSLGEGAARVTVPVYVPAGVDVVTVTLTIILPGETRSWSGSFELG